MSKKEQTSSSRVAEIPEDHVKVFDISRGLYKQSSEPIDSFSQPLISYRYYCRILLIRIAVDDSAFQTSRKKEAGIGEAPDICILYPHATYVFDMLIYKNKIQSMLWTASDLMFEIKGPSAIFLTKLSSLVLMVSNVKAPIT